MFLTDDRSSSQELVDLFHVLTFAVRIEIFQADFTQGQDGTWTCQFLNFL